MDDLLCLLRDDETENADAGFWRNDDWIQRSVLYGCLYFDLQICTEDFPAANVAGFRRPGAGHACAAYNKKNLITKVCTIMREYVRISLELHLFFARIMKEHAFFLEAGFMRKDSAWIQRADFFRVQFEDLLRETVQLSDRMIGCRVLESEELVTPFTLDAERGTSRLSGIVLDSSITEMEKKLQCGREISVTREIFGRVQRLNGRAIGLLNGLIQFKENILREVGRCRLFTVNYPLLIRHIMREARLYRAMVMKVMSGREISFKSLQNTEDFWNRIMMEHALFIRGLLDPSEEELIETADKFAMDYKALLERAKKQEDCAIEELREKSLEETRHLREFKTAGTRGILECEIESLILPLLADHVLREANHYIRILQHGYEWREA